MVRAAGTPVAALCRMADDPRQTGKPEDTRIDVEKDYELAYWSEKFGVSPDKVRGAVAQVGPIARKVREHLQRTA